MNKSDGMKLQWGKEKKAKENTLLIVSAAFPTEKASSEELWSLWKDYKENLKNDGFSVQKYQGNWQISYFHKINSDTYEKAEDGRCLWRVEFDEKRRKWDNVITKKREMRIQIEEDLLDEHEDD